MWTDQHKQPLEWFPRGLRVLRRSRENRILPCGRSPGKGPSGSGQGSVRAALGSSTFAKGRHEADFPAEHSETGKAPRIPAPHGDARRSRDPPGTPSSWPHAAFGLSGRPSPVRGRDAFRALATQGRRARSGPVTVHFLRSDGAGPEVLVAYAISRKVGGAVVRNRCRRRLRVIAAEASGQLPGGTYLIGLAPEGRDLGFQELKERVTQTMRRASVTA